MYHLSHYSFGTGIYNCYGCNQGGESDLNIYGHNSQSQALPCCEQSGQRIGFNRNYHRNGLSNTQVYGTIGNGKNQKEFSLGVSKHRFKNLFKIMVEMF